MSNQYAIVPACAQALREREVRFGSRTESLKLRCFRAERRIGIAATIDQTDAPTDGLGCARAAKAGMLPPRLSQVSIYLAPGSPSASSL